MHKLLVTAAITLLAASPAAAQDAAYDWSGVYVGAEVGYGQSDAHVDYFNPISTPSIYSSSHNPEGWLGGAYAGYNHHLSSNLVVGVDADIARSGAYSGFKALLPSAFNFGAVDIDYSAALRARVGFAVDRFLPYVAGGIAISRARFAYDMTSEDAVISSTLSGWTLGAGFEYAATDNLILRAEYRYSDFGAGRENAFPTFPTHQGRYDLKTQDVRFGISYKF